MRTKGVSSPPDEGSMTASMRGARVAQMRRGIPPTPSLRQQGGSRGILYLGHLGPCSPALSSNSYRRKRWLGRGAARKRRHDRAVVFGVVIFGVLAASKGGVGRAVAVRGFSQSFFERGRLSPHRGGKGKSGLGSTAHIEARRSGATRELGARGCVRASEVEVAEVDRR